MVTKMTDGGKYKKKQKTTFYAVITANVGVLELNLE